MGVQLQSCPGTAPEPPSPLSHVNIIIWSLNMSLDLREFAETLQGLERPHICCPGTAQCLPYAEPCSSPALLQTQPSALCQVLSCFTGMRNVLALATMRGEGCASAHAGRSTSRYLEPFAGLDGGAGICAYPAGGALWPLGYLTFLSKSQFNTIFFRNINYELLKLLPQLLPQNIDRRTSQTAFFRAAQHFM